MKRYVFNIVSRLTDTTVLPNNSFVVNVVPCCLYSISFIYM